MCCLILNCTNSESYSVWFKRALKQDRPPPVSYSLGIVFFFQVKDSVISSPSHLSAVSSKSSHNQQMAELICCSSMVKCKSLYLAEQFFFFFQYQCAFPWESGYLTYSHAHTLTLTISKYVTQALSLKPTTRKDPTFGQQHTQFKKE